MMTLNIFRILDSLLGNGNGLFPHDNCLFLFTSEIRPPSYYFIAFIKFVFVNAITLYWLLRNAWCKSQIIKIIIIYSGHLRDIAVDIIFWVHSRDGEQCRHCSKEFESINLCWCRCRRKVLRRNGEGGGSLIFRWICNFCNGSKSSEALTVTPCCWPLVNLYPQRCRPLIDFLPEATVDLDDRHLWKSRKITVRKLLAAICRAGQTDSLLYPLHIIDD